MSLIDNVRLFKDWMFFHLKQHRLPLTLLCIATAYYCHRLYGIYFPLEADVQQNIYYRLHHKLLSADHNPFQWYYSSFIPFSGSLNPLTWIAKGLTDLVFFGLTSPAKATVTNMISAWLGLLLLSFTVYFGFLSLGLKKLSSLMGAVVVTFTGFHLLGVRQFDHMYQLSMIAVLPSLIAFNKLLWNKNRLMWASIGAFFTGLSLFAGSNVPLFFYLPFYFLLPLFEPKVRKNLKELIVVWSWQLGTAIIGVLSAAAVLTPGIVFLGYTNRANLKFDSEIHASVYEGFVSMFFREWYLSDFFPYYHTDFFLTLPVVLLFLFGIKSLLKEKTSLHIYFIFCMVFAFLMMNFPLVPEPIQEVVRWVYTKMSIRRPHRFFLLALIPIAYTVARGFEEVRRDWRVFGVTFAVFVGMFFISILPNWGSLFQSLEISAILTIVFSVIGAGFVAMQSAVKSKQLFPSKKFRQLSRWGVIASSFFALCYGPTQVTQFSPAYMKRPPPIHLSLPEILGFANYYSDTFRRVERIMTQPKKLLKKPETRVGRVFYLEDAKHRNHEYFAPYTGHRFVFTRSGDPAGSAWMDELLLTGNKNILDVMGVCWVLDREKLVARKPCREEVLLYPKLLPLKGDKSVLSFMKEADSKQILSQLAVNCDEFSCPKTPLTRSLAKEDGYSVVSRRPGYFKIQTDLSAPAYLFLSTLYRFDWEAWVNGRHVPIFRAQHAFMGFPVPSGKSEIEVKLGTWVRDWSFWGSMLIFMVLITIFFVKVPSNSLVLSREQRD